MEKYSFLDDYSEGCHPNILNTLAQTNTQQHTTYGFDDYSQKAKDAIKEQLNNQNSEIFFVTGGTQANLIVISSMLKTYEAVISANTGHILNREAGAIEATGHKIISVPSQNAKLNVQQLQEVLMQHEAIPHMVKPKLVYISNATEIGTIYTRNELQALHLFCQENNLYLFVDGARLGAALCSNFNDLSLEDMSNYCDAFTIGGTKNGALLGEAIVVNTPCIAEDFNINIKQKGALLAKGKILGISFYELFKENLYFELATRANNLASILSQAFVKKGYRLLDTTQTNQLFLILPNSVIEQLQQQFNFYVWEKYDETHQVVRMVTSWITNEDKVEAFIALIPLNK